MSDREPEGSLADRRRPTARIALSEVWAETLLAVPVEKRALAERVLVAPLLSARDEDLGDLIAAVPDVLCFAIVRGAVLKETTLLGKVALEVLGPGDLLVPPLSAARQVDAQAVSRYLAHGPVRLAVIDETFRRCARQWPGLADLLHDRLAQQTHRASTNLAIMHLSRTEDRLLALLTVLANRYGRVREDGVHLNLPLTHRLLGQIVGCRRPTVSLALRRLAEEHRIERREDDSWRLDPTLVTG